MARCWSGPPRIPTFNLLANSWWNYVGPFPPVIVPNLVIPCSQQPGDRIFGIQITGVFLVYMSCPAHTDIHWARVGGFGAKDLIELPAGSGHFYRVEYVTDSGKGFVNEYRLAVLSDLPPVPVPLP